MRYFNCHTHTFNMQYVPDGFLGYRMNMRVAKMVNAVMRTGWGAKAIMKTIRPFLGPQGKKTLAFLSIGLKKTQDMVFEELIAKYPKDDDTRFIILPLNFQYMGVGELHISYQQQLADLFEVKKKYPNKCFPFVSVDARMGNSEYNKGFVKTYIEKGFSGIKLYPSMGYFPFDERMYGVYQYAQTEQIPIMTHCSAGGINYGSSENIYSIENPLPFYKIPGKQYQFPLGDKKLGDYCDAMVSPEHYEEVFHEFPNLKLCFAHMGIDGDVNFRSSTQNGVGLSWYQYIMNMMLTYPNIYMDISYTLSYDGFYQWFIQEYDKMPQHVQDRIMFGTDFFMTVQELQGDDNIIYQNAVKELGSSLFLKLADENVLRYLNSNIQTYK